MSVFLFVSLPAQRLELFEDDALSACYAVSTAANGPGEINGSGCTPRGRHLVRACIGAGQPLGAVFRGRRPTGEIYSAELAAAHPGRDWILTRILWLSGTEPGVNRLGNVDSMRRYIYIHGTDAEVSLGETASHGCIRMANAELVELFDRVPAGTPVHIGEFAVELGDWATQQQAARPVREAVFVVEQKVPLEMEWDADDADSLHAIARDGAGHPIGTGRLLPDGHIGRMAVLPEWRGKGVGAMLLRHLIAAARARGTRRLALHAQTHALGFYAAFGFVAEGPEYDEAGIPHRTMVRVW